MANTYHQVYLQTVFAVKYRNAILDKKWRHNLFAVIGNLINETKCKKIIVGGVEDHVHCFLGLKPSISISELMKTVKAKSSKYINNHQLTINRFERQDGYGRSTAAVFSYNHSQIDAVYKYILNQEQHHKTKTFKEEYIDYLNKFNIDYNEQYIFNDLV
jgi:putative transposase